MAQKYEYKFVRIGEGWLGVRKEARQYKEIIHQHAAEGWRLVQIFAPSEGAYGLAKFYEMIFEREAG
ncbi:MAG: DUF4177 domain-containing protein [Candidatus Sumerlaeia bacterium]